eukprot:CAMPEP_0115063744 /NCGR_PEP_ID=MMETSP0227-20121206/9279_1 /TAXON_ID=89957 /ORGANISM="Polarella glacialis, Strain CCMP 1383" /LENGTH=96 /DNA_ID=CAMNT_0002449283 /DNA_START=1070 /DNA_END=1356 /DNA_ORIENTATION=-
MAAAAIPATTSTSTPKPRTDRLRQRTSGSCGERPCAPWIPVRRRRQHGISAAAITPTTTFMASTSSARRASRNLPPTSPATAKDMPSDGDEEFKPA